MIHILFDNTTCFIKSSRCK